MSQRIPKINKDEQKILNSYFTKLKTKIKLDKVLLFGSKAYGIPDKNSDLDLIVISTDFDGMSFFKRLDLLSLLRKNVAEDVAMDVIGYTPKEFSRLEKESAIAKKAKTKGIWLKK